MVELNIFWTQTAIKQRNHTFKYWNKRNKSTSYSKKLNKKISERVQLLKFNPELGKLTKFKNNRAISLRHYSIIYKKVDNKIIRLSSN